MALLRLYNEELSFKTDESRSQKFPQGLSDF
jgi:hypothetical protein